MPSVTVLVQLGLVLAVFVLLLLASAAMVYAERKVAALIQQREGPNRVGPLGLLQPFADVIKLMFKEELRPGGADAVLFLLAPVISATAAFAAFAVVPFGAATTFFGLLDGAAQAAGGRRQRRRARGVRHHVDERLRHRAGGVELEQQVLAARRPAVGVADDQLRAAVRPGPGRRCWCSPTRCRSPEIVDAQAGYWFGFIPKWFVFLQPVGFLIFMIAGVAETNRAPFDFPEAEQELVAGYHTEYSSMAFAMFFLAEYINMVTVSAVATDLFLGGWHGPFLPASLGWIWFLVKTSALLFFYIWMRWTLPRYRYDQLMQFGWKLLLPLAVLNLLVTAAGVMFLGL